MAIAGDAQASKAAANEMNFKVEGAFIFFRFGCFGGKKTQGILLGFASIPQLDDLRIVFHPMVEQTFRRQKKAPGLLRTLIKI